MRGHEMNASTPMDELFNLFYLADKEFSLSRRALSGDRLPIKDHRMPFHIFLPKLRSRDAKGKLIIGLGGAAVAWAAIHIYRSRSRLRGSIPENPALVPIRNPNGRDAARGGPDGQKEARRDGEPEPESPASDWVAEKEPGGPFSAEGPGSGTESWVESIQQAMDRKPFAMGYDKSVWTAPLLCRYLEETHGVKVPLPRVRAALKDLGYHWKYSRYVRAGNGQPHAQSSGNEPLP